MWCFFVNFYWRTTTFGQNIWGSAKSTTTTINPFKPSDAKWLHFKVFRAILV